MGPVNLEESWQDTRLDVWKRKSMRVICGVCHEYTDSVVVEAKVSGLSKFLCKPCKLFLPCNLLCILIGLSMLGPGQKEVWVPTVEEYDREWWQQPPSDVAHGEQIDPLSGKMRKDIALELQIEVEKADTDPENRYENGVLMDRLIDYTITWIFFAIALCCCFSFSCWAIIFDCFVNELNSEHYCMSCGSCIAVARHQRFNIIDVKCPLFSNKVFRKFPDHFGIVKRVTGFT